MKTILHIPSENRTVEHPNGYHVGSTLKPLGEIEPGVWHMEHVLAEPLEHDPATQYLSQLPGVMSEDGLQWLVGWQVVDIPQPHPAVAALNAAHENGITVSGITLRAGESDQAKFIGLLTMLTEAERFGALPETTVIADAAGNMHQLPTATVRGLLLQYGFAYSSLWAAAAAANAPQPDPEP